MKQIERILVPTDFSDASSRALTYAVWLADHMGASIDLLHIVYPGTEVMDFPSISGQMTQVQIESAKQIMKTFTEAALTRLQAGHDLKQVPLIKQRVEVGIPVTLITSGAEDLKSDIILMGIHGEHNRMEIAFGSITTGVMSRSHVPVLVVPAEIEKPQLRTIGYATGLNESDPLHIWQASQLLAPLKVVLKIVHIKTDADEKNDFDLAALESFLADKDLATQVSFHEVVDDDIDEGLEKFVSENNIDLLIMYSPKRSLFERIGHRSVTRKMALFSNVPLLVMK